MSFLKPVNPQAELTSYNLFLEMKGEAEFAPRSTGQLAHKTILALCANIDAQFATYLHDCGAPKPFTVSPLMASRGVELLQCSVRSRSLIRVTSLTADTSLLPELFTECLGLSTLLLGVEGVVAEVSSDLPNGVTGVSYRSLVSDHEGAPASELDVEMIFLSPTMVQTRVRGQGTHPHGPVVFGSLARKWLVLAPARLRDEYPQVWHAIERIAAGEADGIRLQYHDVSRVEAVFFGNARRSSYRKPGYVGIARYRIESNGNTMLATAVAALARYAEFAGTGYRTTVGMGQVRARIITR